MNDSVHYCGIEWNSCVDGEGFRVTLFVSGCEHHCKGCHNPEAHDFSAGKVFDVEAQNKIIRYICETRMIAGITLSGGDPMYSAEAIASFVKSLKEACPRKTVWVYSGFTYEEIVRNFHMRRLLELCDVLVDGPFIEAERDATLAFRGSANQRIIDVKESLRDGKAVLYKRPYKIRPLTTNKELFT